MDYQWVFSTERVDWDKLSTLLRIAPLNDTSPADLQVRFSNSQHVCFVYHSGTLIGCGRALADGNDCFYVADIAVHPEYQGTGLGKAIMSRFLGLSAEHQKVILYTAPGKEGFYDKLGFRPMKTAMALFKDQDGAARRGVIDG